MAHVELTDLIGKTLTTACRYEWDGNDALYFEIQTPTEIKTWVLAHQQDCCESVYIEDIEGDLDDLVGSPITVAECFEGQNPREPSEWGAFTFYRFATAKGYVTVRFYGESEYYSVGVSFFDPF